MPAPLVSVVVPAYGQVAFLPRALASLQDQTLTRWEAVLVDDGSDDGSAEVAEALGDPRLRVVRHGRNRGLGAACNTGLAATSAPLVAYLPCDDVLDAHHLADLVAVLDDPAVGLAHAGVRHAGATSPGAPPDAPLQLVQVAHRRTAQRWTERPELESDDLELLMWARLPGRRAGTGRVSCTWTDHPGQRHKAVRESRDGGLNVFRHRYAVAEPLRLHSTDSGTVDEVALYARFRDRHLPRRDDGLRVLLAGELSFNPERVLALAERGHELHGTWTGDGLGMSTVGPLPFGHVRDLPRDGWRDALRALRPDVVYGLLNWRAVPYCVEVLREARRLGVPFVWHYKESPHASIRRGEWEALVELVTGADGVVLSTPEERDWFDLALPGRLDPARTLVLDGDLPAAAWFDGPRSPLLSEADGEPHTVVLGRALGLDADAVARLAAAGVHVHLYGPVRAPGPKGAWQDWVQEARHRAAGRFHVHPAVPQDRWLAELTRYDAGWLHRVPSDNGGDLRVASWDDLNAPARMAPLLASGVPVLQQHHPGHAVAVDRVVRGTGAGLLYDDLDDLAAQLHDRDRVAAARRAAGRSAAGWRFDTHADALAGLLRDAAARAG